MKPLHVLGLVAATLLAFCIAAVTPTYGAPFGEVRFGAYVNPLGLSVVTGGKTPDIDDCSRTIRQLPAYLKQNGFYPRIDHCWINNGAVPGEKDPGLFPTDSARKAFALGIRLMMNLRCDTPARELSGVDDAYYRAFATAAKAFGHRVFLRKWEFNITDVHSCATQADPTGFIAAYRHEHDIFVAAGATNVRWVWAPAAPRVPAAVEKFYPGDDVVDEIMFDHYPSATSTAEEDFQAGPLPANLAYWCNRGKLCGVAETAALPENQPAYFASVLAYLQGAPPPNFDMFLIFDTPSGPQGARSLVQWQLTPAGAAAWRTLVTTVSPNSTPVP